jgi:hypothetical protein
MILWSREGRLRQLSCGNVPNDWKKDFRRPYGNIYCIDLIEILLSIAYHTYLLNNNVNYFYIEEFTGF